MENFIVRFNKDRGLSGQNVLLVHVINRGLSRDKFAWDINDDEPISSFDEVTYDSELDVNKYEAIYAKMLIASHFCAYFNWKSFDTKWDRNQLEKRLLPQMLMKLPVKIVH